MIVHNIEGWSSERPEAANTKAKGARILWLDLLRVFACGCVVMLHSIGGYINNTGMYGTRSWYLCIGLNEVVRVGVPLFLMMSGYLLLRSEKSADIGAFYKKRLGRILLPFIVWDIVYFLYYHLTSGTTVSVGELLGELINNGSAYHLWFIYTLFAIYLVTPFLRMIIRSCSVEQLLWLFVLIAFPGTIRPFLNTLLPVYIYLFEPIAEGYIAYFLLGYILGQTELKLNGRILIYTAGIAGAAFGVWQNLSASSTAEILLPANGGYAINHFLCAAAVFTAFRYGFCRLEGRRVGARAAASLSGVTYGVYLAHPLVLEIMHRNAIALRPSADIMLCFAAAFTIPAVLLAMLSRISWARRILT